MNRFTKVVLAMLLVAALSERGEGGRKERGDYGLGDDAWAVIQDDEVLMWRLAKAMNFGAPMANDAAMKVEVERRRSRVEAVWKPRGRSGRARGAV